MTYHLDGLHFSSDVGRSESNNHTSLDDTGLDSADGHCADTTDLVDILERETEGLVGGSRGGLDGVDSLEEGLTLGRTSLGLLGPALVPGHVGGLLQHCLLTMLQYTKERLTVVTVPSGDRDERNRLGVVTDLLDEVGGLLDDFVESVLGPLAGVHLVASNDDLPDTEGEGEEGVLSGLTVLGDTGLELTDTGGDDEDSAVGLRGTGDHVLDEISVTGGVDDGNLVLGGLELPESDVDGDTTLSLGLQFVEDPCVLEGG